MTYSNKDAYEAAGEVNNLCNLWNAFTHHHNNSSETSEHQPPALYALQSMILDKVPDNSIVAALREQLTTEVYGLLEDEIVEYAATLFRFGQFCVTQGMLYANMTPCKCLEGKVEEAVKRILEDADG